MKRYLLPRTGKFYKANLHCHTTYSDGRKTPLEVKELYQKHGYSIVAYTDHDILVPHDELTDENFLALHGFEMEINENNEGANFSQIKTCHICFIGIEKDNITQPMWHRQYYLFGNAFKHRDEVVFNNDEPDYLREYSSKGICEIMRTGREKGFFVTYNHPTWSRENYPEYMGYEGMNAFEIFNGGCICHGYEDYNFRVYDDLLSKGNRLYCIGADDNHNAHPDGTRMSDSAYAFTMIKAPSLEYRDITKALEKGNFYASEGPEIKTLWVEDDNIHIECSDADRIYINYDIRAACIVYAENDLPLNKADFKIEKDARYFRLTVVDKFGKRACTNAYFIKDLK